MQRARQLVPNVTALAVLLATASGCGRSVSQKELDRARNAVDDGLRAWQQGERPESLLRHDPPIQFRDDDWKKGLRLTDYEIKNADGSAGDLTPRCQVRLTLQDRRGKKVEKSVVYNIDYKETVAIVRDPYF